VFNTPHRISPVAPADKPFFREFIQVCEVMSFPSLVCVFFWVPLEATRKKSYLHLQTVAALV
jgi:hypothetical protein